MLIFRQSSCGVHLCKPHCVFIKIIAHILKSYLYFADIFANNRFHFYRRQLFLWKIFTVNEFQQQDFSRNISEHFFRRVFRKFQNNFFQNNFYEPLLIYTGNMTFCQQKQNISVRCDGESVKVICSDIPFLEIYWMKYTTMVFCNSIYYPR